jgi:signal transduction histidine kinase/HAMP domain-containing protein
MRFRLFPSRPRRLREAAATIFALSAILPMLLLLLYLWRFDLILQTEVQIGLLLALLVAVLGFVVFHRLVGRISEFAQALAAPNPAELAAAPVRTGAPTVPGVGQVSEIGQIAGAFNRMLGDLRASTGRLEDLVFKLGTLNEMVDVAARIPNIQNLLDLVLERSMRAVRAGTGSIFLLDQERQTLRLVVARGLPEEVRIGTEIRVGEGIAGKVAQLGEPVLVHDIETDLRFAKANDPRYGSGSFIGMPLRIGDRTVGVVNLARKQSVMTGATDQPSFSAVDLQFLNTLLGYSGYAVDNARLLEEARQLTHRLQEAVEDLQVRVRELAEKSRELEDAKLAAESADRFKSQFVAIMSHELRTPLNSIIGFVKVLLNRLDGDLTERQETYLRLMYNSGVHLLELITSVLDMARIEAGKVELLPEEIDVHGLVVECIESSRPLASAKNLTLEKDVSRELPRLYADRTKLKQILLNLLSNAIKFTDTGQVALCVRPESDAVHFSVVDTGTGIPEGDLPQLFEPFNRRERRPGREVGGTGLGLAISKKLVELHSGQIWVESREKYGSTFHFTLPLKR